MSQDFGGSSWWGVVRTLAVMAHGKEEFDGRNQGSIRSLLLTQGFDEDDISKAMDWFETVVHHGNLSDCITSFQSSHKIPRILSSVEIDVLPQFIWDKLLQCRAKGLLSDELIESIFDCAHSIDTKDLDDDDFLDLVVEILSMAKPEWTLDQCKRLLDGEAPFLYQ